MSVVGIICEYNPFHNGHERQLRTVREQDADAAIVCVMSGNYVQRGEPAVFDKLTRARAAVLCGADLVLELPLTRALSSAEGFADGGIAALDAIGCVDALCFGSETGDADAIRATADALLQPEFDLRLREQLQTGICFAAARQNALPQSLAACVCKPNDILAVEYCKAIMRRDSKLTLLPQVRKGDDRETKPEPQNPSALAIRCAMEEGMGWQDCVPQAARPLFTQATPHRMREGERAVLARLRTMTDEALSRLPYGSEGLWNKFAEACRTQPTVEEILNATKSKRYARTRLCRMLMCAYLGIDRDTLAQPVPYLRVLAFSERGRVLLHRIKRESSLPVVDAGHMPPDAVYYALECRSTDLYALFESGAQAYPAGAEQRYRNFYAQNENNTCKK